MASRGSRSISGWQSLVASRIKPASPSISTSTMRSGSRRRRQIADPSTRGTRPMAVAGSASRLKTGPLSGARAASNIQAGCQTG
ncbi:hypothetical protein ACFQ4K_04015 [Tistrella bauzanensis]